MKNNTYKILLSLIFFGLFFSLNAQDISKDSADKINFISPLGIKHYITGTFGELRPNHLHSGVDLSTLSKENLPVYSVEDGYVSRIKISSYGYGYALYITHYNGYVSVYGHLNSYNDKIESFVSKIQHQKQSWSFDYYPDYNEIKVKQGEIIAYSGNSGHSFGPHLHFEIRDEKTEHIINPFIFNFNAKDSRSPIVQNSRLTVCDVNSNLKREFTLQKIANTYKYNGVIGVNGQFGIQFLAYDQLDNVANKNGLYKIEAYIDNVLYYQCTFDRYSFDESRCLNDIIDYQLYKKNKKLYYRTFISPNNNLQMIDSTINNGVLELFDDNKHSINIVLSDYSNNTTNIVFDVKKDLSIDIEKQYQEKSDIKFLYTQDNYFETDKFTIYMPAKALYDNIDFIYNTSGLSKYYYSDRIRVHNTSIPLNSSYKLAIKCDVKDTSLYSKLLIVEFNEDGRYFDIGGTYKNSYVYINTKSFGQYAIKCDTVAPQIKALDNLDIINLNSIKELEFSITDNLSGVDIYKAFINDKWTVMYYDYKKNKYILPIDYSLLKKGENTILIEAIDERKNNVSKTYIVNYK